MRDRLGDMPEVGIERSQCGGVSARDRACEVQVADAQRAEGVVERRVRYEALGDVRDEVVVGDRDPGPGRA